MLVTPPCGASSNIALWRAKIKPPVELVVGDLFDPLAVQRIFPDQRDRRVHVYGELAAASDWLDDVLRCGGAVWKMEENRGPHPGADAALYLSWRNAGASALLKSTVQQPVFRRGYLGIVFSNSDTASLRYALL